jgi:hypothetical protein
MNTINNIKIEVYELSKDGRTRVGGGTNIVEKTKEEMENMIDVTSGFAQEAAEKISKMVYKPDEIQIKFGVKLTAEAGVVFAKAATEGNFEFTLTWKRENLPT